MSNYYLKATSFRKMDDPFEKNNDLKRFVAYVDATSFDHGLLGWNNTNPRMQNLNTDVAKKIKESLNKNDNFHYLNKGILFSVNDISWNSKTNIIDINFTNNNLHGNIDGGHTLRTIIEQKNNISTNERYVLCEFIQGVEDIDQISEIASARNTTAQVDRKSIAELERKFKALKEALKGTIFYDRIEFKMFESSTINGKVIDVREIIAILNIFNLDLYPNQINSTNPIQSYVSKETSLKKYLGKNKTIEDIELELKPLKPLLIDIFKLYELIETDFPNAVNGAGFRYGSRKYSKHDQIENKKIEELSLFQENQLDYVVPKGIIYPILGSFRALVHKNETNNYYWITDPFVVWEKLKNEFAKIIMESNELNPEYIGKSNNIWSALFNRVLIERFMKTGGLN